MNFAIPPHQTRRIRILPRWFGVIAIAVGLITPSGIRAQSFAAGYAPGCDPAAACNTVRFSVTAPVSGFALNTLSFSLFGSIHRFSPSDGTGTFGASDDFGPFGGFTTVSSAGTNLFINFVDTGDPFNVGFPFTLGGASTGYIDVAFGPSSEASAVDFEYSAQLDDGSTIRGRSGNEQEIPPSNVVPEPSTVALLSAGLFAVYFANRRRGERP
jgi:hypothetical protein